MDLVHSWGVDLVQHLQTKYSSYEGLFSLASTVADLHTTFFFFFPIWFHVRRDTALQLIWVAVIGDWINLVLKWVLFGERPYWWVHETHFYGARAAPMLHQFPMTCETGPGSPSGHAMGAAGVWYVMLPAVLSIAANQRFPPFPYKVYMAAHFPHQVIAGIIAGVMVAEVMSKLKWIYSAGLRTYAVTTLLLTSFAVGFYLLLKVLGVDLLWTLEKAQRWCARPKWVHLDSTPFASLLRNMGSLLGLGLGLHFPPLCGTSVAFKAVCIVFSLAFLGLLDTWTFSSENLVSFYCLSFVKSAVALLIPTTLVPRALCWISARSKGGKNL
ncbi:glucose-6-phosphatase a, catalytic subunit, tandem duplicate 1 isoform X2 [Syngnathoides biaculeatus]|uniref:glucose-6-phosphatase a, catalytic subunit, tandem duplicate 1 isoform X2 n=1 Tax=Syngnathoides biaculeatus TaxID=300417 RepID=UPI002ADDC313|nr:glucose-6-phosphatase a, catalytic subunit, tandem duplicate 1 isoform X2 [Syngnathoides biaculeatus]